MIIVIMLSYQICISFVSNPVNSFFSFIDSTGEVTFTKPVTLHRTNLKHDLIKIFADITILNYELLPKIIDQRGIEEHGKGAGVMKDIIGQFYHELQSSHFHGANEMVPAPRHDTNKEEWKAIARVIVYGLKKFDIMPLFISKSFLSYTLFGEENMTTNSFIEGFLDFVSAEEKNVFKSAQSNFPDDTEELLDILSLYKCFGLPTKENFDQLLSELAHLHLVQAPKYISNAFAEIFSANLAFSATDIESIYNRKLPTARKVAKAIVLPTDMSEKQQEVASYFKKFVQTLKKENLDRFLRYVTGCDNQPELITLTFVKQTYRAPRARVCSNLIELEDTYLCFNELSEEFINVLSNLESFRFSFI